MKAALGLTLAVLLQSAALVAMIVDKQWTLLYGTPVLLEVVPVDPRALFRGDYVRLGYAISQLGASVRGSDADYRRGETVYVTLRQGEPYWQAVAIERDKPAVAAGQVALKGEVRYVTRRSPDDDSEPVPSVRVEYGIEQYFVPEGTGRALEDAVRDRKAAVEVAVDADGESAIRSILIDGKPVYVERLF